MLISDGTPIEELIEKAKRKKPAQLTPRSLKLMRDRGFTAEVVERRLPHANTTLDLWNIVDILCIRGDGMIIGVQVTSKVNMSSRMNKILDSEHLDTIRACNIGIVLHGWSQPHGRLWVCDERPIVNGARR